MSFYSRVIVPRLCDFVLDRPFVAGQRRELLAGVAGELLEIGFGTGLNLPHYPPHVRRIVALDPNPGMHRRAAARVRQTAIEVERRLLSSEDLPFEESTFDSVVSTFTLCSIEQVERALSEVARVLKPGGRFFFLEHGLSPEPRVQKWQRRLNRLERLLADNCRLDRDIRTLVEQQPFRSVELETFYLPHAPRTHGFLSRGVATK